MNCKHCGERLSFEEEQEIRQSPFMAEQSCSWCFGLIQTGEPPDETWDSDSGL